MGKKTVILLTACVNPNGMSQTKLQDPNERLRQYLCALDFYLSKTDLPIVFCENTCFDISDKYKEHINSGRLEYLCFDGNSFDKSKGKGYGETKIIDYALKHSRLLSINKYVVKITGRLIVRNICKMLRFTTCLGSNLVVCDMGGGGIEYINSMVFCANKFFLNQFVATALNELNDAEGVYFEHILYRTVVNSCCFLLPFFNQPMIEGVSGTLNTPYKLSQYRFYKIHVTYRSLKIIKAKIIRFVYFR